jgi:SAM-dependent methyltransferase
MTHDPRQAVRPMTQNPGPTTQDSRPTTDDHQFREIARHYDDLMHGVPYRGWVAYIEEILERMEYRPRTVLDVACGTGNVSEILSARGFEVVGADISADMIEIAKSKPSRVEYYVQDMAELFIPCHSERSEESHAEPVEAPRQFDLAVSLFDSLNYVTDPEHLRRGIARIGEHVVPGGLFIFDVNTIYALSHHFFDQANLGGEHYPRYIWSSEYDHSTRICRVDMLFRVWEDDREREFKEIHIQRGHTLEELAQWLVEGGVEVVDIFHAYKSRKPTRRSDRVFFIARKREN